MNLMIDGVSQPIDLADGATFGDVMQSVSRIKSVPGVGVTFVKLNGEDITGVDWTRFASMAAAEIEALEIRTGDTTLLARQLLDSVEDFAGRLVTELTRTAEALRVGDKDRAMPLYGRALDGIQLLNHTTGMIARNIGIDTASILFAGKPSADHFQRLQPVLDDLFAAQQKEDWVLLADLIEYELIPLFEDHQRVLKSWREALPERA